MDSASHAPRSARGGAIAAPLGARALARSSARLTPGPYLIIGALSLLLAAATLPLQHAPSYDPWAWIIWGREIVHGHLLTTGGPSWKPLPVIFTTLFAPFGGAAPDLWLLLARAGGVMAVGLAAMTAYRLADLPPGERRPALSAAALAAAGLVALYGYLASVTEGESEGLLAALTLLAILRYLDGSPRQALWLAFGAGLIRPEVWPFLGLCGLYLAWREPGIRVLVLGLFALTAMLWFGPELWGSGSLLRGVRWAQNARPGSPALARCPACSELTGTAWPLLLTPFKVGVVLAAAAVVSAARPSGARAVVAVAILALAWILEEAVLTQIGFSGSGRYLLVPTALLIVVGAVGWAWALHRWRRASVALVLVAAALSVVALGQPPHLGAAVTAARAQGTIRDDLVAAVRRAGGAGQLLGCGSIQTNRSEAPLAAWTLGVPMLRTESADGEVVIQSPGQGSGLLAPVPASGYHSAAAAGAVRIFERCR